MLPREVVEASLLEMFKTHLDIIPSKPLSLTLFEQGF